MKTRAYSNATQYVNFKAVGKEISKIQDLVQTKTFTFIYIEINRFSNIALLFCKICKIL